MAWHNINPLLQFIKVNSRQLSLDECYQQKLIRNLGLVEKDKSLRLL